MRLFVTGGTGVIGHRAVDELVRAGHHVTAVSRTPEKADLLRGMGAEPVAVDLFDRLAVARAVDGHEAVVNLATHIPPISQAARRKAWAESDRLRFEASSHLVDAALATGASRFLQESIAFIYPDRGDAWIDEDIPLDVPRIGRSNQAAEAQANRFGEGGGSAVVLRFGQFYAPEATHSRSMASMARKRLPALPGPSGAYTCSIAAADAATAVVAALGVPAGTWNVIDDEPLTRRAFNRGVADAVGAKPPLATGTTLLRFSPDAAIYLRSQRVSNGRFRQATGWAPRHPDAASGWAAMAEAMRNH